MKFSFFTVISLSFLVFSCSAEKKSKELVQVDEKIESEKIAVEGNKVLIVNVEGMVCEMGCGSSIRKELLQTNAVESCSFDFEEERKENRATILFDEHAISANKIVKLLNEMNDKQFKVAVVEVKSKDEHMKTSSVKIIESCTNKISEKQDIVVVHSSDTTFDTPNLLQLFSRLITG